MNILHKQYKRVSLNIFKFFSIAVLALALPLGAYADSSSSDDSGKKRCNFVGLWNEALIGNPDAQVGTDFVRLFPTFDGTPIQNFLLVSKSGTFHLNTSIHLGAAEDIGTSVYGLWKRVGPRTYRILGTDIACLTLGIENFRSLTTSEFLSADAGICARTRIKIDYKLSRDCKSYKAEGTVTIYNITDIELSDPVVSAFFINPIPYTNAHGVRVSE